MLASRTRRAMSWAYWAPKSTTRTGRACSGGEGSSSRSPSGASTRPSSWAWVTSLAGASVTGHRLPAGGGQLALDLRGHLPLRPEGQERDDTGQHHQHHPAEAPPHLE